MPFKNRIFVENYEFRMSQHKYNFDRVVDRRGTGSLKYDALEERFGNPDLIPMWVADMDFEVAPEIYDALAGRFSHKIYGYAAVDESYRRSVINWIDRHYNLSVTPEELAYIPGIVKGIGLAMNFFTAPGDKILIQPPVYHPFRLVTEGNGRKVVVNPLIRTDIGYEMDLKGLEATVAAERPVMMILCNPHNPGGVQWSRETLAEVARIARKYSMIVISDEIHGDLMLNGKKHISFPEVSEDAAAVSIMFGAPSKTFNIAGLVSSWVVVKNPSLREPFYKWLDVNEFGEPTFVATVATRAAYENCEPWLDELLEYLCGTVDAVEEWLSVNLPAVKAVRPDASFLIWLDCRRLGLTQPELVKLFVSAGLALNDGAMFGEEGNGYMRLNIGTSRSVVINSLERLKAVLEK